MKFLTALVNWWKREWNDETLFPSRPEVSPVPRDHFAKVRQHFDAEGNYIFKNPALERMAQIASRFTTASPRGATMGTTTLVSGPLSVGSTSASSLNLTIPATTAGDIMLISTFFNAASGSSSFTCTGVTFTKLGSWTNGTSVSSEIWLGVVNTGGATTLSNVSPSSDNAFTFREFRYSSAGSWTYSAPATATLSGASGTYPSLTPSQNGSLYFATMNNQYTPLGGSSAGFTYFIGSGNPADYIEDVFNLNASSTPQAPAWSSSGGSAGGLIAVVLYPPVSYTAPSAPTLSSPANASTIDVSGGVPFGPTGFNSTDGYSQNAYVMHIKTPSAAYMFWNASTSALQSTIVWNADSVPVGASWSVTLPAGVLSNGNVYNWSMASQESGSNLQGTFATDFTFTAQAPPAVVVNSPTGTIAGTTQPNVTWTDTLASGASQIDYQVKVESGTYGTTPGSGTLVWDSTVTASSATGVQVGTPLTVGATFRVFVQVTQTGSQTSAWAYSTFTIAADVPAAPALTAVAFNDPTTGLPESKLVFQGMDNQLTAVQASCEGGLTTGWTAGANTTIAASNTWAQDGSYSLMMTATAAGDVSANTPVGTSGIVVTPGEVVRAMVFFHSPTTVRSCNVQIAFYNSAGSGITQLISTNVNSTLSGNGGQAFLSVIAPAGAATMAVVPWGAGLSAGEDLYADCMFLGPGSSTTWTAGGFVGISTLSILRSDGQYVRGAGWDGNSSIPANQSLTLYDLETSPRTVYTYTAIVTATVGGQLLSGAPSPATSPVTILPTSWDICDPRNPSTGTLIEWGGDARTIDRPEQQGVFNALNRSSSIVVRGKMLSESFDLILSFGGDGDAAWQAFDALRNAQTTLMVRGDMPGDIYYVALGSARPMVLKRTGNRVADPSRTLTIHCNPVDRP